MHKLTGLAVTAVAVAVIVSGLLAQPGAPIAPPDKAIIVVRVLADAKVTIDGNATNQKGTQRTFITPTLKPGVTYTQEFAARWKEKDQDKLAKKTVEFKAGQSQVVDLTKESPADKIDLKKLDPEKKTEPEKKKPDPETKKADPEKKTEPEKKTDPPKKTDPEKKAEPEKKTEPEKKSASADSPKSRSFLFTYAARIKELPAGAGARVWIPIATSNGQQQVTIVEQFLGDAQMARDKQYGNTMAYFEATANTKGEIPFEITYLVKRKEVREWAPLMFGEKIERYLEADARVPISGKPLQLLQENLKSGALPTNSMAAARAIYDVVNKNMTYKATGAGVGEGDVLSAISSRHGNCLDLDSVFIAMARGNKIAAKIEMGFLLPANPGPVDGYHCWAWFLDSGKSWVPVDIAEAKQHPQRADYCFGNLSPDRVTFSVGRDINLVPRQAGAPLNFFIDPYVEVNGKAYPAEKIQRRLEVKETP